jgi:hypothetical protein
VYTYSGPEPPSRPYKAAAVILYMDGPRFTNRSCGVLVSNLVQRRGIFYGHFEMNLIVWRMNELTYHEMVSLKNDPLRKASFTVRGEFREQIPFCVDQATLR